MTPEQRTYFDNMKPGASLTKDDVRSWTTTVECAREYIDETGQGFFSADYTRFTKQYPIPDGPIGIYLDDVKIPIRARVDDQIK